MIQPLNTIQLTSPGYLVLIPSYNEATTLPATLEGLTKAGHRNILVIDDGSTDDTQNILRGLDVIVLRLIVNCGKGAALKTGFLAADMLGYSRVVTFDADGQHDPTDVVAMVAPLQEGMADVVLGARSTLSMPRYKKIVNYFGSRVLRGIYGIPYTDTQSGLRAFNLNALKSIRLPNANGFEFESLLLRELAQSPLGVIEVPVQVHYSEYSQSKPHRMTMLRGLRFLMKMLVH